MLTFIPKRNLLLAAAVGLVSACTISGHFGENPPDWDYEPPDSIAEPDKEFCHNYAYSKAGERGRELASSKSMNNTAMLTGGLGAFGVMAYISEQEDVTYEKSMKECLQEKGYDLD